MISSIDIVEKQCHIRMNLKTTPVLEFGLHDIIYLTPERIRLLHQIGVHSLDDFLELSDVEIQQILDISMVMIAKLREQITILYHGWIPVCSWTRKDHLIWTGPVLDDRYSFLLIANPYNEIDLLTKINLGKIQKIIPKELERITKVGYPSSKASDGLCHWEDELRKNIPLAYSVDHDYLLARSLRRKRRTAHRFNKLASAISTKILAGMNYRKDLHRGIHLFRSYAEEIFFLQTLFYSKQSFKSETKFSSLSSNAKRPPRL